MNTIIAHQYHYCALIPLSRINTIIAHQYHKSTKRCSAASPNYKQPEFGEGLVA